MPKAKPARVTQRSIITKYFLENPNRELAHPEVVDWATKEYRKKTGRTLRDADRMIRTLGQEGLLIKISNGVYMYDPDSVTKRDLEDFTPAQKKQILDKDSYRCVVCGKGLKDGVTLHVDHIKAKDHNGKATIENGQTLCAQHNFQKKNSGQTEIGKRLFVHIYELAKSQDDEKLLDFCGQILDIYESSEMDSHIKWDK